MKFMFLCIISGLALATVIASVTQISAFAESAQKQQGIEGIWDVSVTIVQCNTGQALGTGPAILMFRDGGSLTQTSTNSLFGTGLGTWRHLRGQDYTAIDRFYEFKADGSFAGNLSITREIELGSDADEFPGRVRPRLAVPGSRRIPVLAAADRPADPGNLFGPHPPAGKRV